MITLCPTCSSPLPSSGVCPISSCNFGGVSPLKSITPVVGGPAASFLRESLSDFACVMEVKLRKNDHKTEWTKMPPELLLRRLQGEALELEIAIQYESPEDAMKEAADVANFAFFIYDRIRCQIEDTNSKQATRKSGLHKIEGSTDA